MLASLAKLLPFGVLLLAGGCSSIGQVTSNTPQKPSAFARILTTYDARCPEGAVGEIHHYRYPIESTVHWLRSSGYDVYLRPGTYLLGYTCPDVFDQQKGCPETMMVSTGRYPEFSVNVKKDVVYEFYCDEHGNPLIEESGS